MSKIKGKEQKMEQIHEGKLKSRNKIQKNQRQTKV